MDEQRYREVERAMWDSVGVRPTERVLHLHHSGDTVRVLEIGDGPPVVFVHGASNAGTSWAPLAARLLDFRCVLVDRPGCGLSPRANRPSTQMRELERVADELVYDVAGALQLERVDVVATSFGGYFALRSAAARPGCVRRLVELGWCFGAPVESTPLSMRVASEPRLGRLLAHIPPTERMVRSLLRQIGLRGAIDSGRFGPVELAWFRSLLRDTDTMRNEIDSTPRLMDVRGFRGETRLPASTLQRVACPVLFVWGSDDPMGGPATAARFASQLPDALLEVMDNAGHAPWIDDPDDVAGRVRSFLGAG